MKAPQVLAVAAVAHLAAMTAGAAPTDLSLELLGVASLQIGAGFDEASVGGLSGLAYDNELGWIAISDAKDTPRAYAISIELEPKSRVLSAKVTRQWLFENESAPPARDAEAIAVTADGWAIGFESPPRVAVCDRDFQSWRVMDAPAGLTGRIMPNRAWESVATRLSASGAEVWAITETPLAPQGGAGAGGGRVGECVVVVFDEASGELKRTGLYPIEPAPGGGRFRLPAFNSLTDIEALPDGRLLAMERSYSVTHGFEAVLFEMRITERAGEVVLSKRRLCSVTELGVKAPGNLEAMALGPALDDERGGRLLLLVADNDFGAHGDAKTQIVALRLVGLDEDVAQNP